jgi:hypothetical protein
MYGFWAEGCPKLPSISACASMLDNVKSIIRTDVDITPWYNLMQKQTAEMASNNRASNKKDEMLDEYTFNQTLEWIKLPPQEREKKMVDWINTQLDLYGKTYNVKYTDEERRCWCLYWPKVSESYSNTVIICMF